jgi:hypothetical protein
MMTSSSDRGWSDRPPKAKLPPPTSDFLSGVKKQLRRDYSAALETSLPEELADLIGQLDKAP